MVVKLNYSRKTKDDHNAQGKGIVDPLTERYKVGLNGNIETTQNQD
jgi:hypothetical protein